MILATGGGEGWGLPELGIWGPVVWCVAALAGYLLFMFFNPLRGYLGESFDLLSEKGHARLWGLVALLSLPGMAWDWWRTVPAEEGARVVALGNFQALSERPEGLEMTAGVLKNVAAVFSVIVAGSDTGMGIGPKNGIVEVVGGALVVGIGLLVQFFLLLFVYLRVMMPGRALKVPNLIDLSARRIGTMWPVFVVVWLAACVPPAFGFAGKGEAVWAIVFSLIIIIFAFLEVAVLAKNVPFPDAVALNFSGWQGKLSRTLWFLACAFVHAVLLYFAAFILQSTIEAGTFLALLSGSIFIFVRSYVLVWLLGAWVVIWAD